MGILDLEVNKLDIEVYEELHNIIKNYIENNQEKIEKLSRLQQYKCRTIKIRLDSEKLDGNTFYLEIKNARYKINVHTNFVE